MAEILFDQSQQKLTQFYPLTVAINTQPRDQRGALWFIPSLISLSPNDNFFCLNIYMYLQAEYRLLGIYKVRLAFFSILK